MALKHSIAPSPAFTPELGEPGGTDNTKAQAGGMMITVSDAAKLSQSQSSVTRPAAVTPRAGRYKLTLAV